MKCLIRELDSYFGKHELLQLFQEPLASDSLDISWGIDVDCYICEVLVLFIKELHRF